RAEAALAKLPETPKLVVERARHALASLIPGRSVSPPAAAAGQAHELRAAERSAIATAVAAQAHEPRATAARQQDGAYEDPVELATRAIAMLEQQGTYDRAFALARQVVELRAAGALPAATAPELVHLARLAVAAGQYAAGRTIALDAIALARTTGEGAPFGEAVLVLGPELQAGVVDRELVALLDEALALTADTVLHCRLSARLAAARQPAPDPSGPIAMARAA